MSKKLFLDYGDKEFYSIGEVSKITGLPAYTLRYWEKEFGTLKPLRRDSRHRKYTIKDIEKIRRIQELLYKKKYTIDGARKAIASEERQKTEQLNLDISRSSAAESHLKELKKEIEEILQKLKD